MKAVLCRNGVLLRYIDISDLIFNLTDYWESLQKLQGNCHIPVVYYLINIG
jgi:hypothetical protein